MDEFTSGREPIQIIEIDQDFCDNTYGLAPCTAAVPGSGPDKCFNTRVTCQDPVNYAASPLTLRFVKPITNAPRDLYLIPSLVSVSTSPTVINAGGGGRNTGALGARATLTATFTDHPYNDRLVDKYRAERSYIATDRSTFWAKWMKRNPYYQNRTIRVLDGYVGQSLAAMSSRTYLIDQITGPDANGRVTVRAKDVLALVDNKKAQAPALSVGELIEDEPLADTTLRITGALAAEYPAPGVVRIGDEVITYAGTSTISGTEINLTGCVRGTNGTEAVDHELADRVQLCLQYSAQNSVDIADDLLTTYGSVDPAYIPIAAWNAERDQWLTQFNVSALITEPTGVNDLLGELTEQCLFYIWWNERDQEIQLKAIRPATETPTALSDRNNIIEQSTAITEEPKERVSQIWIFHGQKDPTKSLDDDKNYARVRIRADLDKESADQYGEQVIKKIYSRWLVSDAQAINLGARLLARYKNNPQYMSLAVDAKDRSLWTGDICDITHRSLVDEYGAEIPARFQVIAAEESDSGHMVKYKLIRFEFTGNFAYWTADAAPLFTVATVEEKKTGCWWSDASGKMSDGSDGYTWQ
jgi:hypothetical protein